MKTKQVLAYPPKNFHWINDIDDLDKLSRIYAKLEAMTNVFSTYNNPGERNVHASELYGFWFIFRDICDDLADILKIDYWTGEAGKKATAETEAGQ